MLKFYIAIAICVLGTMYFIINAIVTKLREKRIKKYHREQAYIEISDILDSCKNVYYEYKNDITKAKIKYIIKNIFLFLLFYVIFYFIVKLAVPENFFIVNKKVTLPIYLTIASISAIVVVLLNCSEDLYNKKFKDTLLKNIVSKINKNAKYYENLKLIKEDASKIKNNIFREYRRAEFFSMLSGYDYVKIYDYIDSSIDENVRIQTMNMKVSFGNPNRSKIVRLTPYKFKGNFIVVEKNINKNIRIMSKKIYDLGSKYEKFEYRFEDYFYEPKVSIEQDIKDYILQFRKKYKLNFDIVFSDNICIRVYNKKMFKLRIFKKLVDEASIYEFYLMNKFIEGLVKK